MAAINMAEMMHDDMMLFENDSEHQWMLLEALREMYKNNELLDITLCVQSDNFQCHRNVLAATSPYFRAMFTCQLSESTQNVINLYEVEASSVKQLIEYAYTGQIEINKSNAQSLLAASSLFQISPIQQACAKFMETQLDISNCVGIHYFAHIHNCDDLCIKAKEHIEKNFGAVSHCDEFLNLDVDKVAELIASNELNVEKEEEVLEAVLSWATHDCEKHAAFLHKLLPLVRFGLIDKAYFKDRVLTDFEFEKYKNCSDFLQKVNEYLNGPDAYMGEIVFSSVLRSGMIKPEHCILLVGGVDQKRPKINCYNPLTRECYYMVELVDLNHRGSHYDVEDPACVVTEDNQIFLAGGNYIFHEVYGESQSDEDSYEEYDEETVRKDFYQYDHDHNCWVPKAPMLFPKSNFALAAVNGGIFCFGGLTLNQHPTEIIERYDVHMNRWSYVGMMPTTLVDLAAVIHNSYIYILGGRTGVGTHNVVMRYDAHRSEWTSLAGMPTPRFNFGACVVGGEIYVAGGQIYSHTSHMIDREALNSVEIYSIENNQWRQGPDLPEEIYNVGLHLINSVLYACGTSEYHRSRYRIYRYNVVFRLDPEKTTWEQVESDLCDIRDFACVTAKMHTRRLAQVFRPEVDT